MKPNVFTLSFVSLFSIVFFSSSSVFFAGTLVGGSHFPLRRRFPNPDWFPTHPHLSSSHSTSTDSSAAAAAAIHDTSIPIPVDGKEMDKGQEEESLCDALRRAKTSIATEIAEAEEAIKELKVEVESIWEDDKEVEYELASAFMHRGDAAFGHC